MALGSLLMPSPPPHKLYHPLDAPGRAPYWECPLALNLGSGVSIPAKLLSHDAAVFSHRRTSWMDLEDFLDGSGGLPGWVCPSTQGPYSFISCDSPSIPELCLLSITMFFASSSWHLIWLLHLDPQTPDWHGSNKPCSPLRTHHPTTPNNLPCSSLTEVSLKLSELSRSAPKTNTVNFNGRACHLLNNSWFSESKADGVTKHLSVKTNSTWFQKR